MAKKKSFTRCEARRTVAAEVRFASDDPNYPYRVCKDVAKRLKNHALTPLEWFRLAAIHSPGDYWLSDDFYDDNGEALQPQMPVPESSEEPVPSFAEVEDDLDGLLDYFFSRREGDEDKDILQALTRFQKHRLCEAVEGRLGDPPRKAIEGKSYLIFQRLLPQELAASIKSRWEAVAEGPRGEMYALAEMAAASVPAVGVTAALTFIREAIARLRWPDETKPHAPVYYGLPSTLAFLLRELVAPDELMQLTLELMDKLPLERRASEVVALCRMRGDPILNWIQANAVAPIGHGWGTTVACNEPSWRRLAKWLDMGRPLSLVALDALRNCRGFDPSDENMAGIFQEISPKICGPVSLAAVRSRLEEYERTDPDPAVQATVAVVLANLEKIFDEFTP